MNLLPPDYPIRRRGSCVPAAYLIARQLPDAEIVCGWIGCENRQDDDHSWVEHGGEIIDPTIRQFRWWRAGMSVTRREVRRMGAVEFARQFEEVLLLPFSTQANAYLRFKQWFPAAGPAAGG